MTDAAARRSARWPPWHVAALVVIAGGALFGALQLAFLCDDAFITFRHVANARDGHGLVWNTPPFVPVEGYTGFSWALLLWGVWALFGVEPPAAANVLSIGLGLAQLAVVAWAFTRVRHADGRPIAGVVAVLGVAVVAGNRTFLQWWTGGLETALFNLAFVVWAVLAFRAPERRGGGWLAAWSAAAAVAALTRPDGLLPVAATLATAAAAVALRQRAVLPTLRGLMPLAVVALHVVWRRATYGDWLPNTYHAKVTSPWPEAGWRYAWCFVFEHGTWLLAVAAAIAAVAALRRPVVPARTWVQRLPGVAAVGTTLAHVGYYVVQVGGDHFEYRVFSHVVPLTALAVTALVAGAGRRARGPALALVALAVAGAPGWLHLALVDPRQPPGYTSLASQLPAWARPLARAYDRHQAWLQLQFVCMRCASHARSLAALDAQLPPVRRRTPVDADDVPIVQSPAIGLLGWRVPDVAVLDLLGLCDRVVARSPGDTNLLAYLPPAALRTILATADADADGGVDVEELTAGIRRVGDYDADAVRPLASSLVVVFAAQRPGALVAAEHDAVVRFLANARFIAHERRAPRGYVQALDPNVTVVDRELVVRPRAEPLTPARVRAIETEWFRRVAR